MYYIMQCMMALYDGSVNIRYIWMKKVFFFFNIFLYISVYILQNFIYYKSLYITEYITKLTSIVCSFNLFV